MKLQRTDWLKLVPALMAAFLFVGCGAPEGGAPEGGAGDTGGVEAPADPGGMGGEGGSSEPTPAPEAGAGSEMPEASAEGGSE